MRSSASVSGLFQWRSRRSRDRHRSRSLPGAAPFLRGCWIISYASALMQVCTPA